ncbi:uncharacterized protein LOC129875680 [Solanum dulcamara]|uniref:uncharacterized protein LOC129875680 n=1 Tax=Solanum dulcamara TaxID=45834 RepID=UPI002486212B|nr:uncharacterized protein LOC129875680 [Solanum dulcamara]
MIETMKAEMEELKRDVEVERCVTSSADREAKIEAPKPPIFKEQRGKDQHSHAIPFRDGHVVVEAQGVQDREGSMHHQHLGAFRDEFKKPFFPNNVIYEAKRKFRELKKKSWAKKELEHCQVSTIDESITQAEALTNFRHDRSKGKETRSSSAKGGGDHNKGKEKNPPTKSHDANKSDGRRFEWQGDAKRKEQTTKGNNFYICGGPHSYARCLEMKNLGTILQERKDKEVNQGHSSSMTHLGMIRLCGAIMKQVDKVGDYFSQYVYISINRPPTRVMVESRVKANIMIKTAVIRLGLSYGPSNTRLKIVNAPLTPVCGVAHGVDITLGKWQGKTIFTITPLDIFDIILGQEFLQWYHMIIDPYIQQLLVMEREGPYMVPLVKMPKKEGQAHLSAMQLVKGLKKGEPTFVATIESLDEDNGVKEALPPCIEKVLEENKDVMPEYFPRHLPPRHEVDHRIALDPGARLPAYPPYHMDPPELEEKKKQLKELLEAGLIRPSKAPYGASVLFQKKKDVSLCLCIDYWTLNKVIMKNKYPILLIADLFDRLGQAKYFTKVDLKKGYYQVCIAEGDEPETTCVMRYGAYEWLVIPFSLTNAPATFCTLMNKIFHPYLDQFMVVYLDDIVIYGNTLEEHVEYLKKGELQMDEAKVWSIKEWEMPIKSEECKRAFKDLKAAVMEEPVLALPDFSKMFEGHTDVSNYDIGGVLICNKGWSAALSRGKEAYGVSSSGQDKVLFDRRRAPSYHRIEDLHAKI